MRIIDKKKTTDGQDVLVVDYYSLPNTALISSRDNVGVTLEFAGSHYLVIRVGQSFRSGREAKSVYFYVSPTEAPAADYSASEHVAANSKNRLDAEFAYKRDRRPASLGGDAPIGWGS